VHVFNANKASLYSCNFFRENSFGAILIKKDPALPEQNSIVLSLLAAHIIKITPNIEIFICFELFLCANQL